jgi:hydroxymethylglutaryl-CoA reductase
MKPGDRDFRRAPIRDRRRSILEAAEEMGFGADFDLTGSDDALLDLSETMVEQAVGYFGVPIGVAGPFLIDGREYMIPLATEEPSVVAAASFAAAMTRKHGGLKTKVGEPVMTAQIFLEDTGDLGSDGVEAVLSAQDDIRDKLAPILDSMDRRGGGWRGLEARWIAPSQTLAVNLRIDVRDAMGANLLNSAAEEIRPLLEEITGGRVLMAILSNRSWDRTASARLEIPVSALGRPGYDGRETARRIVRASRIAREDPDRAVTHNKGIMNGIHALALATGNDTRAIEAAAHAYAGRYGPYHGLSEYWVEDETLHGSLEMPLPFAVTGGAIGFHPASRWALSLLGNPDASTMSRIAAALGLAQNLSALRALVSEGIQRGHMALHARRLAYDAGARGRDLPEFAAELRNLGIRSREDAAKIFIAWKDDGDDR